MDQLHPRPRKSPDRLRDGSELGYRAAFAYKRAVIAMKHRRWFDSEDDAQVELGEGIVVPLMRLVRLCEYLDSPSNRDQIRQDLHCTRGRVSLWLAVHAPKTMDSQGRCKRCFACANAFGIPVGLPENWIDDAALASPYWLIDNIGAWQQPSLEAAHNMMRESEEARPWAMSQPGLMEKLPDEFASAIEAAHAAVQYRLYIRTDDGFVPAPDETLRRRS